MLKENWQLNDVILPEDFNDICKAINDNKTKLEKIDISKLITSDGDQTINGNLTVGGEILGVASSAKKLETVRTINGTDFDGTKDIVTSLWGATRNIGIVNSDGTGTAVTTSVNGSGNVNLKLPATIKASLTGNASTATKLQTARNINGVAFDGSKDITLPTPTTLEGVNEVSFADGTRFISNGNGLSISTPSLSIGGNLNWSIGETGDITTAGTIKATGNISTSGQIASQTASIIEIITNKLECYGPLRATENSYFSKDVTITGKATVNGITSSNKITGPGQSAIDYSSINLPQGGGATTCNYLRLGNMLMAGVSSMHFVTIDGQPGTIYAKNLNTSITISELKSSKKIDIQSIFDILANTDIVKTKEGLKPSSAISFNEDENINTTNLDENTDSKDTINVNILDTVSILWKVTQELKKDIDNLKQQKIS